MGEVYVRATPLVRTFSQVVLGLSSFVLFPMKQIKSDTSFPDKVPMEGLAVVVGAGQVVLGRPPGRFPYGFHGADQE